MTRPLARRASRRVPVSAVLAVLVGAALAGCVTAPTVTPSSASPSASATASASAASSPTSTTPCTEATRTQSYPPSATSAYVDRIRARKYLVVGVAADTRLLGAVDPGDPNSFNGFDIDVVRMVARAVFGSGGESRVRFQVITTANRVTQLTKDVTGGASGGVDMVVRAFTMTCPRWQQVAFSAEYLEAHQGLLASRSLVASVQGGEEPAAGRSTSEIMKTLAGRSVCATAGSTSLATIQNQYPALKTVAVASNTDCMVLLQQGRVDAVTSDDTILAGFQAQDPTTAVVKVRQAGGPVTSLQLSSEPYGIGVPHDAPDFAAFINKALADWVGATGSSSWQASYNAWLAPALGSRTPPAPQYGRT